MKHFALITAKGGNLTLKNKNLIKFYGLPSVAYSIIAAKKSKYISKVFLSTEDTRIKKIGLQYGAIIIDRPSSLSLPDSKHGDVISHAVEHLLLNYGQFDTLTTLLGNTVMTTSNDIDLCLKLLSEKDDIDSVMTVWKAQDDHPYRAMKINSEGFLESFIKINDLSSNRQSYPDVYFYDQGPWSFKIQQFINNTSKEGPGPWWWMGKRSIPIERIWMTGRDTHNQFDVDISKLWLKKLRNKKY